MWFLNLIKNQEVPCVPPYSVLLFYNKLGILYMLYNRSQEICKSRYSSPQLDLMIYMHLLWNFKIFFNRQMIGHKLIFKMSSFISR